MWTFREGLSPAFREQIRDAFLHVTDPGALAVFRADAFVPAQSSDVDVVRRWIAALEAAGK